MGSDEFQIGGSHYTAEYQHWNMVADFQLDYYRANATKYMTRHRSKNGLQDVQKAGHYIDKLVELLNASRISIVFNFPPHIGLAMIRMANEYYVANEISNPLDQKFFDLVLMPRNIGHLIEASEVLKQLELVYPPAGLKAEKQDQAPASLSTPAGGRYRPSLQFTLEGYRGNRDCWQCRKCFAHFELPADTNPEAVHVCGSDDGDATRAYVDQARDGGVHP